MVIYLASILNFNEQAYIRKVIIGFEFICHQGLIEWSL